MATEKRASATAALRLLADELEVADGILEVEQHSPDYRIERHEVQAMLPWLEKLPDASWREHKTTLAATLPYHIWWDVSRAYHWMAWVRDVVADPPTPESVADEEEIGFEELFDNYLEFVGAGVRSASRYLYAAHQSVFPLVVGDRRRYQTLLDHGIHEPGMTPDEPLTAGRISTIIAGACQQLRQRVGQQSSRRASPPGPLAPVRMTPEQEAALEALRRAWDDAR